MRLYRPVGLLELALIDDNDLRAFPPRLPEQPIFYPVLHVDYARQIAAQWNTRQSMVAGYVTPVRRRRWVCGSLRATYCGRAPP
jgi:hypothetical protein